MDQRNNDIENFIQQAGLGKAKRTPLTGDASTRRYERLSMREKTFLFMNAPQAAESTLCPPLATPEERKALGYNASARLAGNDMHSFAAIAQCLQDQGLSAPVIHHMDAPKGFAILEDLGFEVYAKAITEGRDEARLYQRAIDVLITMNKTALKPETTKNYHLHDYDMLSMQTEIGLLSQWYWPEKTGTAPTPDHAQEHAQEHAALWGDVLNALTPPSVLVLRDYHAENLLWLPQREGAKAVGIIDFQDALWGNHSYDLVSLLEDARREVAPALVLSLKEYFYSQMALTKPDQEKFEQDYALMGAQRNAKILGIFVRLAKRDNKNHYLTLIPWVEKLFRKNLDHPALKDLRKFYIKHIPTLFSS